MKDRHILLGSVLTTLLAATVAFGQLADPIKAKIQKRSITIELETVASGLVAPNGDFLQPLRNSANGQYRTQNL